MAARQPKKKKNKAAKRRKDVYSNRMDFFLTRKGAAQVMVLVIILALFIGPMRTIASSFSTLREAFYSAGGIGQDISSQLASVNDLIALADGKIDAEDADLKALKAAAEGIQARLNERSYDFGAVVSAGTALSKAAEPVYTKLRAAVPASELAALEEKMASARYAATAEQIGAFNRMAEEYNAKRTASFIGRLSGTPVVEYLK